MIEWGQWLKWNMLTESDDLWYLRTGVPNSDIVLTSSHAELCVSQPHCQSVRHWPISPLTHNWLTLVDFRCVSLSSCSLCFFNRQEEVVGRHWLSSAANPVLLRDHQPDKHPNPSFRFMSIHQTPTSGSPVHLISLLSQMFQKHQCPLRMCHRGLSSSLRTSTSSLELSGNDSNRWNSYREPPIWHHTTLLWSYRFWQIA